MSLSFTAMKKAIKVVISSGHVPNIVGVQGIGKSDLVREFARENGFEFAEITCSLVQEGDLAMPYISQKGNGEKGVAYAINNIITDLVNRSKGNKQGILFLDEFNRSTSQVQSELMNLVLQREVTGYKLPDNIKLILAMNPSSEMSGYENTDYSVSYSDSAILGRVVSLNLSPNLSDWVKYGKRIDTINNRQNVHKIVISYLSNDTSAFVTPDCTGRINNTPRGWKRVSDILYSYEKLGVQDLGILSNLVSGTIDADYANAFVNFYRSNADAIDFISLAHETLFAKSVDEWSPLVINMNDIDLNTLFKCMLDYMSLNSYNELNKSNIITLILAASKELSFSWLTILEKKYSSVYADLLSNNDFANYAIDVMVNIRNTEVGGFSGK